MGDYGDLVKQWQASHGVSGTPTSPGIGGALGNILGSPGDDAERKRKQLLQEQAAAAGGFAGQGEQGFNKFGQDAQQQMDYLRQVASGQQSISGEQLRQGLQQNQSAQRSMAAGASPQNAPMAARTAAINMARQGYGMSGQAATAGLQERRDAQMALAQLTEQLRQQSLQAALGSRGNAITGYGAGNAGAPEKSWFEKYGPAIIGAAAAV